MYQKLFLALARKKTIKTMIVACPATKAVLSRFVAGGSWDQAAANIGGLLAKGLRVSASFLGERAHSSAEADQAVSELLAVLDHIDRSGWAGQVDLSVNLDALGLSLRDFEATAAANLAKLADKARQIGTTITVDTGRPALVTRCLRVVQVVRERYPEVGCSVQADLRRAEGDCRALDTPGIRLRLCKGSDDSARSAYTDQHDIDLSYVRCLKTLMEGDGVPLIATHDPVLIDIAQELAAHSNRSMKDFEFQMLYGVRLIEQERLADLGHIVRIYVPFGPHWYEYLMRRIAERPANLLLFARALVGLR